MQDDFPRIQYSIRVAVVRTVVITSGTISACQFQAWEFGVWNAETREVDQHAPWDVKPAGNMTAFHFLSEGRFWVVYLLDQNRRERSLSSQALMLALNHSHSRCRPATSGTKSDSRLLHCEMFACFAGAMQSQLARRLVSTKLHNMT